MVAEELLGIGNVPVAASVIGDAEENAEREVALDGFVDELREIARTAPLGEECVWPMEKRGIVVLKPCEANANDGHAVMVHVVAGEGFPEDFGACVDGPRARWHFGCDPIALPVVQDGLSGARENDARNSGLPSGFKNAVNTVDIYGKKLTAEIGLIRNGGEVNQGFGALAGGDHFFCIADVCLNKFVVAMQRKWFLIDHPEGVILTEQWAEMGPNSSPGPGNDNAVAWHRERLAWLRVCGKEM